MGPVLLSRLLGLTLTKRQNYPMAGLPYHASDTYVSKILAAGKKVAICEQQEAPKPGKLVKRELTRILTPGTTLAANQLDAQRNHYLAALSLDRDRPIFARDPATGPLGERLAANVPTGPVPARSPTG